MPPPSVRVIAVVMRPIIVIAPNFLIHQAARISIEKPIKSHKKGRPNIRKKMGAKILFNTAHKVAQRDIAAISLGLKHVIFVPSVIRFLKKVILLAYLCVSLRKQKGNITYSSDMYSNQ